MSLKRLSTPFCGSWTLVVPCMVLDFVYRELAGESTELNCRALAKQYFLMGIGPL